MGLTVFYRVLPGFAGLNWVLMGSTRFKRDFIAYQQKEPEKLFYWSFLGFFLEDSIVWCKCMKIPKSFEFLTEFFLGLNALCWIIREVKILLIETKTGFYWVSNGRGLVPKEKLCWNVFFFIY